MQGTGIIGTDQIKEPRSGEALAVSLHRIDSKRYATPAYFLVVDFAAGVAREGQSQEAQSIRPGDWVAVRFERRLRRWNEEKPVQAELLEGGLGDKQVPQMHRIK